MKFFVSSGVFSLSFATVLFASQFDDAVMSFERGSFSAAETTLQSLLKTEPANGSAWGLLGAVLDSEKKYNEADAAYKHALHLTPNSPTLLNNYANHQLATGDSKAARITYLKAIQLDPGRPNANLQLAAIDVDLKNGKEALACLDRLPREIGNNPQAQLVRMQALYVSGQDAQASALEAQLTASDDNRILFSAGLALAKVQHYSDAEKLFSRVLQTMPSNFDVQYNMGLAAYHAGDLERARDLLNTAVTERPKDVDTLYNLAGVYIALKQKDQALGMLAEAGTIDPGRANVQLEIAQTASALGYYADALIAYDRYLKLVPGDESAQRERAFVLGAGTNHQAGVDALKKFIEKHPRDTTALYDLGILEAQTDPEASLTHLNKVIQLDPDSAPARLGRGSLRYMQGDAKTALPDLEFAASKYPDNSAVLDRLGETYLALDRAADAVNLLRKAAQIAPSDGRVLLHFGRALAKAGDENQAKEVMARFRSLGPEQRNIPAAGIVEFLGLPREELRARYRKGLEKELQNKPDDPTVNTRALKSALEDGDRDTAQRLAAKLLEIRPPAPLAAEAGRALEDYGLYAQARPLLQFAVDADPQPATHISFAVALLHLDGPAAGISELDRIPEAERPGDYYLARAEMLDQAGRADEAIASLQAALHKTGMRADLCEQAALLLARQQRPADAVALLDQATRTSPDDPNLRLMRVAMLAAESRPDVAESALKQIQTRWPEWAPSYVTYGILLQSENRADEARTQLETAVSLGANTPQVYAYLARAILATQPDRLDDASKAIDQALKASKDDPLVLATAGRVYAARHDYDKAAGYLEQAVRLKPDDAQARFVLAQAYRALGRTEDARRESQEFQRLQAQSGNANQTQ